MYNVLNSVDWGLIGLGFDLEFIFKIFLCKQIKASQIAPKYLYMIKDKEH